MAQFEWVFDAPTGTFKQHALSRQLLEASIEMAVFPEHAGDAGGFGRKQGESVTWTRVGNITEPTTAVLSEVDRIPEDNYSLTTRAAVVQELGRAVPFTSLAEDLSWFDLENSVQGKLRQQMTLVLDALAATAFKSGQHKWAPTGITSRNLGTGGTFGAAATVNLGVWHLEEMFEYLFDTLHADPAEGDDYIGIFRSLGLRGVSRDPDFEEWRKYTDPSTKFNNEMGRWSQIRLIRTNHNNALGQVGTGSVLGEGVVFGADAVRMAEAMAPELRAAIPQDFGRKKAVAWYGVLRFQSTWGDSANAGEANIIHVGST